MPEIDNDGVAIHYEIEGNGPPMVLLHGSFGSLEDWREYGYVDALRDRCRLILIDARGHGKSGKPHDPAAYDLFKRVSDVVRVLDQLGVAQAEVLGYSMGGWMAFGLAHHAPKRVRACVIGGAHPFQENMQAFRNMLPTNIDDFAALLTPVWGDLMTPSQQARIRANDLVALAALTTDRDDFSDVLGTMTMPSLLFCGGTDPRLAQVERCAVQMPNAQFVVVPDSGHVATFVKSAGILPQVTAFLDRIS